LTGENGENYKIELDIYNGPLDLLLFLVYKNEVDIFNIPIADILEQYLAYVEVIKALDIEVAGEFLVLASRLMNIKSKLLMPRPEVEPQEEEVIDPRAELVRELLEFKEAKERAYALEQKRLEREQMYERVPPPGEAEAQPQPAEELEEEASVWDLLLAFHRITKDFMPEMPRRIVYDDTPVAVYVERLLERVAAADGQKLAFSAIFEGLSERIHMIGMFLAVLDAAKRGALRTRQVQDEGEIYLEFVPETEREVLESEQGGQQVEEEQPPAHSDDPGRESSQ
jgi:segregation and condensation protein A